MGAYDKCDKQWFGVPIILGTPYRYVNIDMYMEHLEHMGYLSFNRESMEDSL